MSLTARIMNFALAAAISAGPTAVWAQPTSATATSCSTGDVTCLDQGWNDVQRSWWYSVSQGSRLLPLGWALALKTPDDDNAFFGRAHLRRLGYLDNPASDDNPYGLPVGFVVDHEPSRRADLMCSEFPETCRSRTMRAPWLGLNCSACHTTEIVSGDTRLRIEGAPALADFTGLVHGVEESLRATIADQERFGTFANAVLGGVKTDEARDSLRTQIEEQLAWMEGLRDLNGHAVDAGPARLDAQGHILTKVSMINGAEDQTTNIQSDAPSSYPFIWNTHQQEQLQWNGIAKATLKIPIFGRETDIGALIRNTSEVIGVFAQIEADRGWAALGYSSSVRVTEMVGLERQLSKLESPVWPEGILGPIDRELAARGDELFDQKCASCHAHLDPEDLHSPAGDQMTPLAVAGTDVFLACNTYLRTAKAGNMSGQRIYGFGRDRISETDATRKMLINASVGAIFGKLNELIPAIFTDVEPEQPGVASAAVIGEVEYLPGVVDAVKKEQARECLTTDHPLLAYKTRPLNGIWATAPYLHNGSVPTLYDLLLPARIRNVVAVGLEQEIEGPVRPESFGVGGRIFDAENVGFSTAAEDNPWTFNVRDGDGNVIPGNSNAGHDYGNADLSGDDRRALVEYLKTL